MRQFFAIVMIMRPHNMIAAAGCVACAYYLSGGSDYGAIVFPLIFTAIITGFGNMINDYYDADIDRVNKPRRPIPSGRLSSEVVVHEYWLGTLVITAVMVRLLPLNLFFLMTGWEVLLFLYARFGKRWLFGGNLLISAIVASSFIAGAMMTGNYDALAFPLFFAFVLVMGRELIKGAEDEEGDRNAGAATLAVRVGGQRTALLGALVLFICVVVAPVPALTHYYSRIYGLAVELLFVPGVLVAAYLVLRRPNRASFAKASWILKFEMIFGIAALALGRVG